MELKSNIKSPVLTDSVPNKKSIGPIRSGKYITIPRKMAEILDNTWLEAMKSSSPPPYKKRIMDFNIEVASDDYDLSYYSWMCKHPSALKSFCQIANHAKNKRIAMFLDYDGTLSPIVDDPDRAFMSDAMRSAVKNVAEYFPTTIISGRSRDKVYELVGLTELYYAGSHGMDIKGPSKQVMCRDHEDMKVNLFQPATRFLPMINEVFRLLVENTKGIAGAKVENHKFCASVHYRNVDEKSWGLVGERVHDILKGFPHLRLAHGRKVLEIRPVIDWNKGKAVEFLLDSLGLSNREDVVCIYMGDDRTDEDAFKMIKEGNRGYGILVSSVPKETKASFSLRDPSEVMEFLNSLLTWKKRQ